MTTYIIQPMLEDFPIGPLESITYEELMPMVFAYNYGTLGHCDAWFTLTTEGGMELDIADYYEEAEKWYAAQPAPKTDEEIEDELYVAQQQATGRIY